MRKPRVTFFVPTYQYGHYLAECVHSILKQSYEDFEILILDDCSRDQTPEVANQLAKNDPRVIYIRHKKNKGHMANYNHGIAMAQGEFLWCVSADDCLTSPDILQRYMTVFEQGPATGLAFCRAQVMDEESQPVEKWVPRLNYPKLAETPTVYPGRAFYKKIVQENFVPVVAAMARKACYEKAGHYNPKLTHTGDWHLWMQFSLGWDVYYDPEPMVSYRIHRNNMHRTYTRDTHTQENTLACYEALLDYIQANRYGWHAALLARLAMIQYKRKQTLDLESPEKLLQTLIRPFVSFNR